MSKPQAVARAICASISLFALTVAASGQTPAPGVQQTGTLPGGGTYIVRRDETSPTVAVELWYRAPAAGYDSAYPGIARLALAAVAASAPAHGTSFAEHVTRVGGTLSINVYPDIAMIGASVPSWQAASVLRALTTAYFSASISQDALKAAVRDTAIAAAASHFDAERLLQDAMFERLFSAGPAHYPPIPDSVQAFAKIPAQAVRAFATRAFRRDNAVLALSGGVDSNWLAQVPAPPVNETAGAQDGVIDSTLSRASVDAAKPAQVGGIGIAWVGPPIADPKAATAMDFIADYLFDADHGTVATAMRKANADAFLNGQFITLHDPGVLLVTVSGDGAGAFRSAVLDAANSAQQPLDARTFEAARNAFVYNILSQTQTPTARADNFGWYAAEGNAPYAPGDASGEYLQAAQSLDPGYVAQTARKYLQHPAIVQLLSSPHAGGTAT